MGSKLAWVDIQRREEYRGRWVALDECVYDTKTAQPVEGSVVDADDDLMELCARMRENDSRHCAILFCASAGKGSVRPPSVRSGDSQPPPSHGPASVPSASIVPGSRGSRD